LAYEDVRVHVRLKLFSLWCSIMFFYIYGDYFELYQPGKLRDMIAGSTAFGAVSQGILLGMASIMVIPSLMPFLSLVLPRGGESLDEYYIWCDVHSDNDSRHSGWLAFLYFLRIIGDRFDGTCRLVCMDLAETASSLITFRRHARLLINNDWRASDAE
jgi:hypothetical protein